MKCDWAVCPSLASNQMIDQQDFPNLFSHKKNKESFIITLKYNRKSSTSPSLLFV